MPNADKILALRGMRDVFSAELNQRRRIQASLENHLRLYAYAPVELPILENTELYLRKGGEDMAARLYEFDFRNRRIALRPELTASVLRAYVERLGDAPLPLRAQYAGPVFRYEKPQHNRFRQFTLAGAELIGAAGPLADAEVMHLACGGLESLGIGDYRLVVGHTGALECFLRSLGLREQLVNLLLRNMENLRKRGTDSVLASLQELYPDLAAAARRESPAESESSQQLIAVLRQMSQDEAHQAIGEFLRSLNIRLESNRDADEIIDRLLRKIREDEQAPKLRLALEFMTRLSELSGAPADVLPEARQLLNAYDVEPRALDELEAALNNLGPYGDLAGELALDFGMNRGLHYYTGLVFEIRARNESGDETQLCGGGRYDNLISALGGGATPALGFAWGIERIASLLPADTAASSSAQVILMPLDSDDIQPCLRTAHKLRGCEISVEMDADSRSLRRRLKRAARRGAPLVIIVGERERATDTVVLRDMRRSQEASVNLAQLPAAVQRKLADS